MSLPLLRELDGDDEEGEAPGKVLPPGHDVQGQSGLSQLRKEAFGAFVAEQLDDVAFGAGRPEDGVQVVHGEGQVHVEDVLDGDNVDLGPHLAGSERLVGPDRLGDVLVGDAQEVRLGRLLEVVQAGVVDQASGHQVGGVVGLEEGEELVAEVAVGRVGGVEGGSGAGRKAAEGVMFVGCGPLNLKNKLYF